MILPLKGGAISIYLSWRIKVRNAVINRFLFDGNLKIADADKADLVLKGQLLSYDRSALRYTDNGDVQEYRVHITVSLEMHNAQNDVAAWMEAGFVGKRRIL